MKEQLIKFIKENNLFKQDDTILLTVSGGIDSMTMLHLFIQSGFSIAVAHCNFCLRGKESDGDQELVERFCQSYKIPLFINRFDTLGHSEKKKISIQMAARELRYSWFTKLASENNFSRIATAHNANDVAETFFINLTRKTGLHGLTGINLKLGNIIRPLLFASRKQIEAYAKENEVPFREDSSNADTKYLRNAIRHKILPELEKLNPSFLNSIIHTSTILKEAETVFNSHVDTIAHLILSQKEGYIYIDIAALKKNNINAPILFEVIKEYGFSFDTAEQMIYSLDSQTGISFYSDKYKVVKDRTSFILYPLSSSESQTYYIDQSSELLETPLRLKLEQKVVDQKFELKRNREVGTFDFDKLEFPLILRRWKEGDYFYPFGMRGKKKLSDYFSDQKFSIPEKENTWLLCSGKDIIWVLNHRTDNRYCVTSNTKSVLQIEWLK